MRKKIGKTVVSTLTVAVLSLSAATFISANQEAAPSVQVRPIKADVNQEQAKPPSQYISVTGTIQEISDYGQLEGMRLVSVTTAAGEVNQFVVSDETYGWDEPTVGSEIIAFYDANVPVIMIYPPQYQAVALVLADDSRTVKVDHFDENLVSADGSLKLNISEETDIILPDGTAYAGELTHHDLVVSYGPSTRSIPAQTTPEQIMVLPGDELPTDEVEGQDGEAFARMTGTIKEITELVQEGAANQQLVAIESAEGETIHIVVSDTTYVDEELAVGAELVAFYNANAPMTMIYPPRYQAEAVALMKEDSSVMVDRFDETLLNSDQSLRLSLTDETVVVTQAGEAYEGELMDRKLFVEYQVVTLSFPGQTAPTRIVVLEEHQADAVPEHTDAPSVFMLNDLTNVGDKQWVINDESIAAPSAYLNEQGTVMVPIRAITEALGYELTWESDTMTVRVGNAISLQIGNKDYVLGRMAPIQLDTAPELVDQLTYVPLDFFKEVIHAEEVIVDAERIMIRE